MNARLNRIAREELLWSLVWFGLGMVGWTMLVDGLAWLDASALTVAGLPVLTWGVLTAGAIGIRYVSATDLQLRTQRGFWISVATGATLNGLAAAYLVAFEGFDPLLVGVACGAITAVTAGWYRCVGQLDPFSNAPV